MTRFYGQLAWGYDPQDAPEGPDEEPETPFIYDYDLEEDE